MFARPESARIPAFFSLILVRHRSQAHGGVVRAGHQFLAGRRCAYYTYSVDEHWSRTVTETYTDNQGKTQTRTRHESGWKTVASGGEMIPFYLQDDYGFVLVRPEGAKIEPQNIFSETCGRSHPLYYTKGPAWAVSDSEHGRRFTEQAIVLHAPLYIMGQARERQDVVAAESLAVRIEIPSSSGLSGQVSEWVSEREILPCHPGSTLTHSLTNLLAHSHSKAAKDCEHSKTRAQNQGTGAIRTA